VLWSLQVVAVGRRDGKVSLIGDPLFLWLLATAHLFGFKVLVKEIQRFLICLFTAHDREHALASFIVWCLGNGDAGTGAFSNFADLRTASTDDAADHVGGYADILGLNFLAIFGNHRNSTTARCCICIGGRSAVVSSGLVEIVAIAGAIV
jgi:hypothetical protein